MHINKGILLILLCFILFSCKDESATKSLKGSYNSWTRATASTKPDSRANHAMAYDSQNDQAIMFGGSHSPGYITSDTNDETWVFNFKTNNWTNMHPRISPPARYKHTMTYDARNDKVILFGGYAKMGSANELNDETWVYDYNTNNWTNMNPKIKPSPREGHAMVYDSLCNMIILFGGGSGGKVFVTPSDETWTYEFKTNTWSKMNPSIRPLARYDHAMSYDSRNDRVILVGGKASGINDETWAYDFKTDTWINMNPSIKPVGRYQHSMVYNAQSGKIILFGGSKYGKLHSKFDNETWLYDFAENQWREMKPPTKPSKRFGQGMTYSLGNDTVVLFGGIYIGLGGRGSNDETWIYKYKNTQ